MATARITPTFTTSATPATAIHTCINGNHKSKPENDGYLTRIKSCLCYEYCFPLLAEMLEEAAKEEQ